MIKNIISIFAISMLLTGCPLEDDCSPDSNNYSHSEYDCYNKDYSVEVCNRNGCHDEVRSKHVCEDVYICYEEEF